MTLHILNLLGTIELVHYNKISFRWRLCFVQIMFGTRKNELYVELANSRFITFNINFFAILHAAAVNGLWYNLKIVQNGTAM